MKRSSSVDCSSIGQSLKRVKISCSPGELRLDRDIESLIFGKRWTSTAMGPNDNSFNTNNSYHSPPWDRRETRIHGELYCHNARLVRDPVDPLRLQLTCVHQPMSSQNNAQRSSSSPIPPERWTFLIQMPRMYPHVPPGITRVTRDLVPNNENMAHLGNMNVGYGYQSASAAIVASSVMQSHVEPPVPEHVLINPLPPTPNLPVHGGGNAGSKLLDIDLATSCFNVWSPVSSLQDLLDFLTAIPARRREWWSVESNRRHHLEQHRFLSGGGTSPVGQPTIAPAASFALGNHQQHQQHFQPFHHSKGQHQIFSSHCDMGDMEHDGGMHVVESMMEDAGAIPEDRHINPFTTNRFDVGYDRGSMIRHHWGVR